MTILWTPRTTENTLMEHFTRSLEREFDLSFKNYEALYQWSVQNFPGFWEKFAAYCDIYWHSSPSTTFVPAKDSSMLGHSWFPGGELNYAQHLLSFDSATITSYHEGEETAIHTTMPQLRGHVYDLQKILLSLDLKPGERVAGVCSNNTLSLTAMLATTSLGGIWASCSPDFGVQAIVDRMSQISPRVLFLTPSYQYAGKIFHPSQKLTEICQAIPSLESIVLLDHLPTDEDIAAPDAKIKIYRMSQILKGHSKKKQDLKFLSLPFAHPLFIMFSSGTTGVPKCIIHSAGGTLLQHLKEHRLHCNIDTNANLLYYTTCGWMMWNWSVSALASGASLTLYEGAVHCPDVGHLWRIVEQEQVTHFGTSPKFLALNEKQDYSPKKHSTFAHLDCLLSTGSPLLPEQFDWVYTHVKSDLHLASICGGTDILSCFILGHPGKSVRRGEIQVRGLGMAVEAWNDDGQPVYDKKGELVCVKPFPSMPIGFWDDPQQKRYKAAYFENYPQHSVWHHGDFIEIKNHGGIIVYGRSDATLNPGGVRIGTAEIYRVVEQESYIVDTLAIGVPQNNDIEVWLFVKTEGSPPADWQASLRHKIKTELSPRHVPSVIHSVEDIPYTRSGKKVELAVLNIIRGLPVKNQGALANPEALKFYEPYCIAHSK